MVEQLVNSGIQRIAVFHQNDAFGEAGLAGVEKALAQHKLKIVSKGSYEKNTEAVADAVAHIARGAPQAVILVGIVRPVGAFIKAYLAGYPGTQMFSLSVVSAAELSQVAGDSARGVGITQVMPSPFNDHLRVVKEYQGALARFAPGTAPTYTSFEEYVGTRALIEALRNAGPNPGPAALHKALAALDTDLGGFKLRFAADKRVGSRFRTSPSSGGTARFSAERGAPVARRSPRRQFAPISLMTFPLPPNCLKFSLSPARPSGNGENPEAAQRLTRTRIGDTHAS
ncbi:MAG: ABC transporter substrate-binding protein [Betaproteobacteria bacterium]|nr:ABC transporter substrate-binding protein [Betaproteobacteria bacterium]